MPRGEGLSLFHYENSQYWWCRFKVRGREYRLSTGKIDRREAEAEERRLRVEAEQAAPDTRRCGVGPLSDLAGADVQRAIREGADPDIAERTLTVHWTPLLIVFGAERDIGTITLSEIETYVSKRRAWPIKDNKTKRVRGQTIRRELAALRRAFKEAKKRGWIAALPDFDIWPKLKKDPPSQALRGKLRAPELLRKLLAEANDRRLHGTTDATVRDHLVFCIVTGIRWGELQRVTDAWIEEVDGLETPAIVRFPEVDTKTGEPRYVGLPQEGLDAVKRRREVVSSTGHLFPHKSLGQWLRRWSAKEGISPAVTLRDLRHTYSTLGLQGSNDAAAVQAAMGHSDLRTTQLYQSSTVARVAKVGVAVAASVFGKARGRRQKRSKGGRAKAADQKNEDAKYPKTQVARLAQLDRATVSEADDLALFLAEYSFSSQEEAQRNPGASQPMVADTGGRPSWVVGWISVKCLSCEKTVEVFDQGELRCMYCTLPLDRSEGIYVE